MHKHLFHIFLLITGVLSLGSCNDDFMKEMSLEGDVPIVFNFMEPGDMFGTRGTDDYKKTFQVGDMIHIQGTYVSKDGATASNYGAMRLNAARKWEAVDGSGLYWPYDAESGTFTAYYVYNTSGLLSRGTSTRSVSLSEVKDDEDPLRAESASTVYGHTVNLQFEHACTYLTLEKMEANVADYFWFLFPGNDPDFQVKNAYQLSLSSSGDLFLEFISVPDPAMNNLIYISRPSEYMLDDEGKSYSKASFYLAPGTYNNFDIRTNNNFPFMSFKNSLTEELLANHPYTLNVEIAKGASTAVATEEDWTPELDAWEVDVEAFLRAVANKREYTETDSEGDDVPILRNQNGALVLLRNLDFHKFDEYDDFDFQPNVGTGTIFEGNHHYIRNLGHPLFRYNYGTIRNLALEDMETTVVAKENRNFEDLDESRIGGLCHRNLNSGVIENIRLGNFNMTINVQADDPEVTQSNDNFSFGFLCGSSQGAISDVSLKDNFTMTIQADPNNANYNYVDANLFVGGLVGQLTTTMVGVGPQPDSNFHITINNNSTGRSDWGSGEYCIGGAAGAFLGTMMNQIMIQHVTINALNADCYQQYTGGLVGRVRCNGGEISNCTVEGTLTCGTVSSYGANNQFNNAFSYIGGLCGSVRNCNVNYCSAVCDLETNMSAIDTSATYASGGAFGRILAGCDFVSNTAWGNSITGPAEYIGTFAGIAQTTNTWASLQAAENRARQIGSYQPIGIALDDTETGN